MLYSCQTVVWHVIRMNGEFILFYFFPQECVSCFLQGGIQAKILLLSISLLPPVIRCQHRLHVGFAID